jgi:hypothetical protein
MAVVGKVQNAQPSKPPARILELLNANDIARSDVDVLPFGRLWYGEPDAVSNAIALRGRTS